jgi:polar amino acid transport system substrate-binding protein
MMIPQLLALTLHYGVAFNTLAQDAPVCPAPITFALYENGYIYETESNSGIDKDVAEELSKRSGCRFEFSVKPRARIWAELENGNLMMTGSAIQTGQRDGFAWFVNYMAQKNYVLLAKSLDAKSAAQFAASPNLLWGAVRSYKHGEKADAFLQQMRQDARVMEEADLKTVFRRFATPERTSALLAPPPAYAKYIKEMNLAARVRIEDWFPEDKPILHGLVFSKKFFPASEMKKWRGIILQMLSDGTLKAIYKKYLGEVDAERMLPVESN